MGSFFITSVAWPKPLTLEEVSEATCRVIVHRLDKTVYGSGTTVAQSDTHYFILTNGHLLAEGKSATVEYFKDGYKTNRIPAEITWTHFEPGTSNDVAILSLSKENLKFQPRIIQVARRKVSLKPKQLIYGAGSPSGKWIQSWQARIIGKSQTNDRIYMNMAPAGGQSGSGILSNVKIGDEYFTRLVGIVTWRIGRGVDTEIGGGISLSHIYNLQRENTTSFSIPTNWVKTASDLPCSACGAPKDQHIKGKMPDGSIKLFCPICNEHNKLFNEHTNHNQVGFT